MGRPSAGFLPRAVHPDLRSNDDVPKRPSAAMKLLLDEPAGYKIERRAELAAMIAPDCVSAMRPA